MEEKCVFVTNLELAVTLQEKRIIHLTMAADIRYSVWFTLDYTRYIKGAPTGNIPGLQLEGIPPKQTIAYNPKNLGPYINTTPPIYYHIVRTPRMNAQGGVDHMMVRVQPKNNFWANGPRRIIKRLNNLLMYDERMAGPLRKLKAAGTRPRLSLGVVGDSTVLDLCASFQAYVRANTVNANTIGYEYKDTVFHACPGATLDRLHGSGIRPEFMDCTAILIKTQLDFMQNWAWGEEPTGAGDYHTKMLEGIIDDLIALVQVLDNINPSAIKIIVGPNPTHATNALVGNPTVALEDPFMLTYCRYVDEIL